MSTYTLAELAARIHGTASEEPGPVVRGARPLEFAAADDITYVTGERFRDNLAQSAACAVIVPPDLEAIERPCIRCANPEAGFARLTELFYGYPVPDPGVSPLAAVASDAVLGESVSVGPFVTIGAGSVLGEGVVIGPHCSIGSNVEIGAGTRLFPNVTIYDRITLGKRVIIHSGTVIGSDGFGFARDADERGLPLAVKKYHCGTVEIEDDVEIGALCTVDRALAGTTRIGAGVKIDNLVQIAHNVTIGAGSVIAAQSGIAGSSTLGRYCLLAGQVGVRDHVVVGDGVTLATRAGIYRDVPSGAIMAGSIPAMPHRVFLRAQSLFKRLPEMLERIRRLEGLTGVKSKDKE
jgi:UDP-3-O-[3-hydroxymyristoyl] glucosamine N-acyltransferase